MNLSERIQQFEPVTTQKLERLTEEAHFYCRSIYDDRFSAYSADNGQGVRLDFHSLQYVERIGLFIEVSHEGWHSFLFEVAEPEDFVLDMARALPDEFTKQDILNYLTEVSAGDDV